MMNKKIQTTTGYVYGDKIYIWGFNLSALFEYSFETGETKIVSDFDNTIFSDTAMQGGIANINDDLVITPLLSQYILKYSLKTKKSKSIPIPLEIQSKSYKTDYLLIDDKIYIFPKETQDKVLVFDNSNDEINEAKELTRIINNFSKNNYSVSASEKSLFLLFHECGKLIETDIKQLIIKNERNIQIEEEIMKIEIVNNRIWLLLRNSFNLYEIKEEIISYVNTDNTWVGHMSINPYSKIVKYNNDLIVLNYYSQNINKIDSKNRRLTKVTSCYDNGNSVNMDSYGGCYQLAEVYDDRLWIFPNMCRYGIKYDGVKCEKFSLDNQVDGFGFFDKLISAELDKNNMLLEDNYSLSEYINYLKKE